jgi:formate hydrogenlyase transcriptional activator
MPSLPGTSDATATVAREQVSWLSGVMDAAGRHTRLAELLPDVAAAVRRVVPFHTMAVALPQADSNAATLYTISVEAAAAPALVETSLTGLPTYAENRAVVFESLESDGEPDPLLASLQAGGAGSACVVPLASGFGPVGVVAFARLHANAIETPATWDLPFLQLVGHQMALAIDNLCHQEAAVVRAQALELEHERWRTLFDVTKAVVTKRDLTALRGVITASVRRIVPHDHTNLYLFDDQGRLGPFVIDPTALAWPEHLAPLVRPDAEPYRSWLAPPDRTVEVDVEHADPTGWEALLAHVKASGVKRICNAPLSTPHRVLGVLSLGRLTPVPFTKDELDRVNQVAAQIAIALENATAFDEIAALKERLTRENVYLQEEIRGTYQFQEIVGQSKALQRVLNEVSTVAATDTAVLLLGETGTGKELLARALHAASDRRSRALVTVNCTTSPAGLLESEWFGHEKGAFTGALSQKVGRFELAHQGTLFLDEIGDVPLELQSKLLRVLQEHEVERLGSTRTIRVDFRLIAATNRNLEEMVGKREFRSDLYYRLNVFPVRIPPLRERREDIPPLVLYFAQRFAKRLRRSIESVSRESLDLLCRWPWPGNIRELQNVIERAVILSRGPVLTVSRTEFETMAPTTSGPVTLEDAEREHILRALAETNWVIGGSRGAAARLGLKRTSLVSTMRRLHITRPGPERGGSLRPRS